MKNKTIIYALMVSLLSASFTAGDACKRMRDEEYTSTPNKMQKVMGTSSPSGVFPFETLPRDMQVTIARFFDQENTRGGTLIRFAQVSRICNAIMLDALPYYNLEEEIYYERLTSQSVAVLKRFRTISMVSGLAPESLTDEAMGMIVQLGNVCKLSLTRGRLTREGLAQLAHLSPKLLELQFCYVEPADATAEDFKASIGSLTNLKKLDFLTRTSLHNVGEAAVSVPDIANALSGLTDLTTLIWEGGRAFDNGCMQAFAGATKLKTLYVGGTSVTNDIIPQLKRLTGLEELVLHNTHVTPEGKADLKAFFPALNI